MGKNKNTIWQILILIGGVLLADAGLVFAQSSSTNYQAVDFINAESSLSTSSNYQLNDSLDYYGGTANSNSYKECTGDAAVLSDCSFTIVTPPTVPPSSGSGGGSGDLLVGAGSIYYAHEDCNQIDCINTVDEGAKVTNPGQPSETNFPVEKTPIQGGPTTAKPPFQLLKINEPNTPDSSAKNSILPGSNLDLDEGGEMMAESIFKMDQAKFYEVVQAVASRIDEETVKAKVAIWCEDMTCEQLRSSAKSAGEFCAIYTFGGYQFVLNCLDWLMIWATIIFISAFIGKIVLAEKLN